MIIKKLAVPFINEKLLQQVEHCYIATAAVTEAGFDFIRTRIPTKSKMEIVTGLAMPTSPGVLQRIWRNYQGRITLNIYTRNDFHANVYIFDLPYRKSVAFVGSGQFTLDGIKDSEELFYKVTDAKEIETLKSWFIGYYEFAQPLSEAIIAEYEWRYPMLKRRFHASQLEKQQFLSLTTGGFSWDQIKFKLQYFKKEDYLTLSSNKAPFTTQELHDERKAVQEKFMALHELIYRDLQKSGLHALPHPDNPEIHPYPFQHTEGMVRSLGLAYGRSGTDLKKYDSLPPWNDVAHIQIALNQQDLSICLVTGMRKGANDREYFKRMMGDAEYRKLTHRLLGGLGAGYWIEVACERKNADGFPTEEALWEFTKADEWMHFDFLMGRNFAPDAAEIRSDTIAATIVKESDKLAQVLRHMSATGQKSS